jgi:putative flippase GtrA
MKEVEKVKLKDIDFKKIKWNTIIGLYLEYKEIINYIVFGLLATLVNFISYFLFAKIVGIEEVVSSMLSWFCSVLFAYITNKIFVFESKTNTIKEFLKEMISFFLARILSGILCDVGTFALMVKILKINDIVAKIVTQVMVVIANYVLSRWVVFKNK